MFETFRVLIRLSNQLSCLGLSWWHPPLRKSPQFCAEASRSNRHRSNSSKVRRKLFLWRSFGLELESSSYSRHKTVFYVFLVTLRDEREREAVDPKSENSGTFRPSGTESFCGCWVGFVAESCDCISSLPWSFWKAISNQGRVEYVFRSCCLWNGGMRFLHARVLAPTRFSPPGLPEDCVSLRCFRCVGYTTQITMLQPPLGGFVSEKNIEFILRNLILDVLNLSRRSLNRRAITNLPCWRHSPQIISG